MAVSTPKSRKVLGPITPNPNPNPIITLTSETLVETVLNSPTPFKSKPMVSTTKNQDPIAGDPADVNAQFLTVPIIQRRSRIKPKSKSKVKIRPVPRRIQLEAAEDSGALETIGQPGNEGFPLPSSIVIEPGFDISRDALKIDDIKSPESTTITPAASHQISKSAEIIPAVEPEIENPTPKQFTLLEEAMGRTPEVQGPRDEVQPPKVSLRKLIRAAKIKKLESRKARDSTATLATSDQKLRSPESIPAAKPGVEKPTSKQSAGPIPAVKPKINKPTFKPSALLNEAMGGQFEVRRSRDAAKAHENALQRVRGSARIQGFDRRKSRDLTVTPSDYGLDAETVAGVLDSVVTKRLDSVGSRLESAIQYGKDYNLEQSPSSDQNGVLLPPNTLHPLDYAVDTTRMWLDSMENGYRNERAKGKGSVPATISSECKGSKLVKGVGANLAVSDGSLKVKSEEEAVPRVQVVKRSERECWSFYQTRADI